MNQSDDFRGGRNGGAEDGGAFDESVFSDEFFADDIDERFADWVDGRLGPAEVAALEEEMALDDELRQRAEAYRDTVATLRVHLEGEEPPADLAPSVMAELPGRPGRNIIPLLASLTAAAAMVILYVVLREMTATPAIEEIAKTDASEKTLRTDGPEAERGDAGERERVGYERAKSADDPADAKRAALRDEAAGDLKKVGEPDTRMKRVPEPDPAKLSAKKAPAERPRAAAPGKVEGGEGLKRDREKLAVGGKDAGKEAETQARSKSGAPRKTEHKPGGVTSPQSPGPTTPIPESRGRRSAPPTASAELRRLAKFYLQEVEDEADQFARKAKAPVRAPADEDAKNRETAGKQQTRRARNFDGGRRGRGGRGGAVLTGDTPVLLLTLSSASPDRTAGRARKETDKARPKRSVAAEKKVKTPTKGDVENLDEVQVGEKAAEKKDEKVEEREEAARRVEAKKPSEENRGRHVAEKGLADRRPADDSFAYFLETTNAVRSPNWSSLGVRRIVPSGVGSFGRRTGEAAQATDYAYRTGDELYAVSGDEQRIKQFFLDLKRYLDSRRVPETAGQTAAAPLEKDANKERTARNGVPKIPMSVKRLSAPAVRSLFRSAPAWSDLPERGELRFVLVLRRK